MQFHLIVRGVTALTRTVSGEEQIYSGNLEILPGIGKPGKFFGKYERFSGHWAKIWYYMLCTVICILCMRRILCILTLENSPWYEKTNQQRFQLKWQLECDWPRAIPRGLTQEPCRCKAHTISMLSWKWYISRTISKTAQNIKYNRLLLREVTPTENKHKNDNWFREQFLQNLSSQNTRNDVSEHQDFKNFWGSMLQTPLVALAWFVGDLKRTPRFYILKKLDNLSVSTWYPQCSTTLNEKITKVR